MEYSLVEAMGALELEGEHAALDRAFMHACMHACMHTTPHINTHTFYSEVYYIKSSLMYFPHVCSIFCTQLLGATLVPLLLTTG